MGTDLMDATSRAMKASMAGDIEGGLDIFDQALASSGIDILSDDYLRLLDMKYMLHMRVVEMKKRKEYHLKKAREALELYLATPYSYTNPHGRIDADIGIRHIDEWLKEPEEEAEEGIS